MVPPKGQLKGCHSTPQILYYRRSRSKLKKKQRSTLHFPQTQHLWFKLALGMILTNTPHTHLLMITRTQIHTQTKCLLDYVRLTLRIFGWNRSRLYLKSKQAPHHLRFPLLTWAICNHTYLSIGITP
ncbi:hypothetical protein RSOL_120500 [Rhizoctonia solani AG-3 Rhs1AP]|uniref:Uncharacterized protein n=2 Tax=Rhizoctonia solani AG-3 TaxID=1086053 RepID=A0A074RPH1_9AGAM|nr:hypothetical protein RSOL_120500 [Rhizoctonia solani AG-3 Rhs1AP]KEP48971.1 hypothetical protein V565_111220 [Rhizoctonia solani 123E]